MAIHELALLVTFYGVTVSTIASVKVDNERSSLRTIPGPSGKLFTDFDKVKFTVTTTAGETACVVADRCGGDVSYAMVADKASKAELFRYSMPDEDDVAGVASLRAKLPRAMPYFLAQDADYVALKDLVGRHCLTGAGADAVATLDVATEAMKVAEYLTPLLMAKLS